MVGINDRVIGRCSLCNGCVVLPNLWHGVQKPTPRCDQCGAVAVQSELPLIPMEGGRKLSKEWNMGNRLDKIDK